ncbi:MAG: LD-carboxypeptidase [Acidobacteriota bacterium]
MIDPTPLPPPVRPGGKVGVAALAGPVAAERLAAGLRGLERLGYRPVKARNLAARDGLFAGSDAERLEAFHELAARDDIEAILFARGGWGVLRLIERIDWRLLANRPRPYVGYSDLTPFLLALPERAGFAAFHGPMVAADLARGLDRTEAADLVAALSGRPRREHSLAFCEPGPPVEGTLFGGSLSLLTATLGTKWAADLEGALLFVEDLHEPPFRLDRMLTHLRLSGTLNSIRGMVVGHLHALGEDAPTVDERARRARDAALRQADRRVGQVARDDVIVELAEGFDWPLGLGLAAGHSTPNTTLPLGVAARFDPAARQLRLVEVGVGA